MGFSSDANGADSRPEVSVLLPFYNGSAWLLRSIDSVRSQQAVNWELVVVDDGSFEDPEKIIEGFEDHRIRYIRRPHAGKGAALNAGIRASRADLVCFIDQDDIMLPQRLQRQLAAFRRHSQADAVYSDYERRYDDGRLIDRFVSSQMSAREALHHLAIGKSPVSMQTLMLRKDCLLRLGGFSEDLQLTGLDDLELFVRLFLSNSLLIYAPGAVQSWVFHERNFSSGSRFQESRLHWLECLSTLSEHYPELRAELKHFRFHSHGARGLFFLEKGQPGRAGLEFIKALRLKPLSPNTIYLLLRAAFSHLGTSCVGSRSV